MPIEFQSWQQRVMAALDKHKERKLILRTGRGTQKLGHKHPAGTPTPLTGTTATHVILDDPYAD